VYTIAERKKAKWMKLGKICSKQTVYTEKMYFFDGYQKPSKMIGFVFRASLRSVDRAVGCYNR